MNKVGKPVTTNRNVRYTISLKYLRNRHFGTTFNHVNILMGVLLLSFFPHLLPRTITSMYYQICCFILVIGIKHINDEIKHVKNGSLCKGYRIKTKAND